MSVVAPVSAVVAAAVPALVGILLGERLSTLSGLGIVIAVPAIGLIARPSGAVGASLARSGLIYGTVSGIGFALLFVALHGAGTSAGAWPLVAGQAVSLVLVAPFALCSRRAPAAEVPGAIIVLTVAASILSGTANLLYLAATGQGPLAVVAVVTALYAAVTVLLARVVLRERWSRGQAAGLIGALVAVALMSAR